MATCKCCGEEFDVSEARRVIGRRFGAGTYNDQYPDNDVCIGCASAEISAALGTWDELRDLMGPGYDEDD